MDQTWHVGTGFKVFCWIMAVLCFALVVLAPGGFLLLWIAHGAYVKLTHDTLEVRWIGRRQVKLADITKLEWLRAAGVIGAMMQPLGYHLKDGSKWSTPRIPIGVFKGDKELLAELQKRTGLTVTR